VENSAEPALHAKGQIRRGVAPQPTPDLRAIWQRCALERPVNEVYELQRERHIVVGPSYQWLVALRCGENEAMARLCAPAILAPVLDRYSLHPGLIDSCFGVLVITQQIDVDETFIPFAAGALQIYRPVGTDALLAYAVVRQSDRLRLVGDIHLYTEEGEPVASFIGLEGRRASRNALLQQRTAHAPATYRLAWEALATPPNPNPSSGSWLVFSDASGPGAEIAQGLAQNLRAQGLTVVLARAAAVIATTTGWRVNAEDDYSVAPHEPEDMHKLLAQCGALDRIVYLWGLGYAGPLQEEEDWRSYQQQALAGALHLSQALATRKVGSGGTDTAAGVATAVRVCWVTQGAQAALLHDAVPAPHQAAVWGMAHTLAQEAPGIVCATVDLQPETTASQSIADLMLALAAPTAETRLACRQGEVHAARLDALPLKKAAAHELAATFKPECSYLITGAQGALGRVLVDWLAAQGVRHLALLGRSNADTDWLQSLEQRGVQARWYRVDVADYDALQAALAAIRQQQAPLGGVFHLAGQVDDGLIGGQNWPRFGRTLAAKAHGAWNLHRLIPQPEVLFVNFASIAGLLGSAGQASYAAANAVLDALAQQRRAMGLSGLSVDWGPWAEVGMAARLDEAQRARLESIGVSGIVPSQGLAILSALIDAESGAPAQVGVLALDWTRYTRGRVGPFLSRVAEVQATDEVRTLRQQWQEIKPAERRALLLNELIARVAEVLRLSRSEVAPRQRLFDLGVDSLIAVELKNRLETLLGMTLSTTLLFDYPTIEALADYLMELLGEADRPTAVAEAAGTTTATAFVGSVEDLSEDQAEAELLAQLALLEQAGN
ncbi:MAG TPA: type I polyketide synthase, partial [Rhodocyclaceae bacterium]|nr:type I polyketide synthase [Rhodocyclaceae bacterium]